MFSPNVTISHLKLLFSLQLHKQTSTRNSVCEVGVVGTCRISSCQPGGAGFDPQLGQGLDFVGQTFATPSFDSTAMLLVSPLDILLGT